MKEKEKLFKELDKIRKELEKKAEAEKAKKEAEKVKREAKRKLSDKGAAPPELTGVSMALEEKVAKYEELYEALRNENEVSGYNHHLKLLHRYMQHLLLGFLNFKTLP